MDKRKLAALAKKNAAKSGSGSAIPKRFGKKYDQNLSDDPTDEATIKKLAENERFFAEMKKLFALAALVVATACATVPSQSVKGSPGNRDKLFAAEIESNRTPGMTAYDLISHARPEYLRSRGANSLRNTTPPTAIVYLDLSKYGDLESLRSISADVVKQVEYLTASSAQTRFGMDHTGGAILVTTR